MRTVLWDKNGDPILYCTGSGVVYTLANRPVGVLLEPGADGYRQVVDFMGGHRGWYRGGLMWDREGCLFAFGKGVQAPLELPRVKPLRAELKPIPAPGHPLALPSSLPPFRPQWSQYDAASFFGTEEEVERG
ncbi:MULTISPECIES: 4-fold beta flower protein [unclassified Meiothermus]|uniref:4-fold beta flower protein n=1 Tax=unclassified Meiothermus TaxID=370471 RepID=UPI000D7BF41A|nr:MULTISPECIES: hypothetical protein [unclassified Meiothermus]PZA06272.1 hypothetical protein DNA98_14345 [Meiothermus sp. Pnk-1]RYM36400.1 hypothetical protein EWH23_10150 [Meiothermus sp. PNK-Is4]